VEPVECKALDKPVPVEPVECKALDKPVPVELVECKVLDKPVPVEFVECSVSDIPFPVSPISPTDQAGLYVDTSSVDSDLEDVVNAMEVDLKETIPVEESFLPQECVMFVLMLCQIMR